MGSFAMFGMAMLQAAAPATSANPSQLLADRMEVAFRACALQLTKRDYLTRKNAAELTAAGITLNGNPPAPVSEMASRLFGITGIYASVAASEGAIWIAASATVPACKVTVADTALSLTARYNWTTKLRSTAGWSFDRARSGVNGNLMRDLLVLNAERPGSHMIVIMDGPNVVYNDGKGIQTIMTVALETAKAK